MPRSQLFSQVGAPETVQLSSPFFKLPAEIRNDIYTRVFDYLVVGPHPRNPNYARRDFTSKNILLVCKQTHAEAIRLFYRSTVFHFHFLPGRGFKSWIQRLGRARASLMKEVRYDGPYGGSNVQTGSRNKIARWKAEDAQRCIERRREEGGFRKSVVRVQLELEEELVWTAHPKKLLVSVLQRSVYVNWMQMRFWICNPPMDLELTFGSISNL